MLKSMTAFGRERAYVGAKDITVEIKSVNNRYFDCQIKLPHIYSPLEQRIKQRLQSAGISRGKIDVGIYVELEQTDDGEIIINEGYAEKYIAALRALKEKFSLDGEITVMQVAHDK